VGWGGMGGEENGSTVPMVHSWATTWQGVGGPLRGIHLPSGRKCNPSSPQQGTLGKRSTAKGDALWNNDMRLSDTMQIFF
jgi:hypothetical protein